MDTCPEAFVNPDKTERGRCLVRKNAHIKCLRNISNVLLKKNTDVMKPAVSSIFHDRKRDILVMYHCKNPHALQVSGR